MFSRSLVPDGGNLPKSDAALPQRMNLDAMAWALQTASIMMSRGGDEAAEDEKKGRRQTTIRASASQSRSDRCPKKFFWLAPSPPLWRLALSKKKSLSSKSRSRSSRPSPASTAANASGLIRLGGSAQPFWAGLRTGVAAC